MEADDGDIADAFTVVMSVPFGRDDGVALRRVFWVRDVGRTVVDAGTKLVLGRVDVGRRIEFLFWMVDTLLCDTCNAESDDARIDSPR